MARHRKGAPRLAGSVQKGTEKVNQTEISKTKDILKKQQEELEAKLGNVIAQMNDPNNMTVLKNKTAEYFKSALAKLKKGITLAQLTSMKERLTTDIADFNEQVQNQAEIIQNIKKSKEILRKSTSLFIDKVIGLFESPEAPKDKILYVTSGYLIRWEDANSKEIDKITDLEVSRRIFSEVSLGKGPIFRDYRDITREVQTICAKFATPDKQDDLEVFQNENWLEEYKDEIESNTGSSFNGDINKFLKWARRQAFKSKFPPLPNMLRANGTREKMKIGASFKKEMLKKKVMFISEIFKLQNNLTVLTKLDKNSSLSYAKPILDRFETEATINILKNDNVIGRITRKDDYNTELKIGEKKYNISLNSPESIIDLIKKELNL